MLPSGSIIHALWSMPELIEGLKQTDADERTHCLGRANIYARTRS